MKYQILALVIGSVLALPIMVSAAENSKKGSDVVYMNGGNSYRPLYSLTGCSLPEPNGYFWTGGTYNTSCIPISGHNWAYVFESYFDKPVGTEMIICSDTSKLPNGWFVIGDVSTTACADGRYTAPKVVRSF